MKICSSLLQIKIKIDDYEFQHGDRFGQLFLKCRKSLQQFQPLLLGFWGWSLQVKNIYLFELCFLGCVCRDDPKGECSWTSEIMQKETELEEVSHKYIFFTMYQFFTQPLGILCPITFNQNICKYVKIHKHMCKTSIIWLNMCKNNSYLPEFSQCTIFLFWAWQLFFVDS